MQKVGGELPKNLKNLKVYENVKNKNNNNAFNNVLKRLRSAKNHKSNNYNTAFTRAAIYGNINLPNNHSTKRSKGKNGGGKTKRKSNSK
jgi:hypothetical protein